MMPLYRKSNLPAMQTGVFWHRYVDLTHFVLKLPVIFVSCWLPLLKLLAVSGLMGCLGRVR